jgi:hypothetical protein
MPCFEDGGSHALGLPSWVSDCPSFTDIKRHSNSPPSPIPRGVHRLPAISQLRKHDGAPDEYVKFQITEYFPARQSYRELYFAEETDTSSEILVKFSRRCLAGGTGLRWNIRTCLIQRSSRRGLRSW